MKQKKKTKKCKHLIYILKLNVPPKIKGKKKKKKKKKM